MIPYDKRSGKIWYNDELVDWGDVKLHVLSHGLHYASCVFEGERVYDGSIFKLEEHTSRFFHSAKRMGFEIPYSEDQINIASNKIIATQKVENGYVRPVAWRGSEMMAISAQKTKIHVAIATWEWGSYFDPKLKVEGIRLNISNWRRPAPNTIPWDTKASGLYMICTLSKHEAEKQGLVFLPHVLTEYKSYKDQMLWCPKELYLVQVFSSLKYLILYPQLLISDQNMIPTPTLQLQHEFLFSVQR